MWEVQNGHFFVGGSLSHVVANVTSKLVPLVLRVPSEPSDASCRQILTTSVRYTARLGLSLLLENIHPFGSSRVVMDPGCLVSAALVLYELTTYLSGANPEGMLRVYISPPYNSLPLGKHLYVSLWSKRVNRVELSPILASLAPPMICFPYLLPGAG